MWREGSYESTSLDDTETVLLFVMVCRAMFPFGVSRARHQDRRGQDGRFIPPCARVCVRENMAFSVVGVSITISGFCWHRYINIDSDQPTCCSS